MFVFPLMLLAATAAIPAPATCDAKPFTLAKPAVAAKSGAKAAPAKAEAPKPILKPSCNHPGHGQPGHKH